MKAKHRKALELRHDRAVSRAGARGGKRNHGPAMALWKRVNAIIDRLGEQKLADATAPMIDGGFFDVWPKYAPEFARELRRSKIRFRQKLIRGAVVFYLYISEKPKVRRNPAAMDGHTFVVIAHGKDGEVAYRGREAHLSYGAAWREAQIVARRRGLTDVHIVKDGKDIVGEVKARSNPSAFVSSHEAIRKAVRDASFEFAVGPLLLINRKVDPLGGLWVAKRGARYEVWAPGDVSETRYMASTPTAVADYAWGYLRGKPETGYGPSIRRRNPLGGGGMVWRTLTDRDGFRTFIYVPRGLTGYQSHRRPGGAHASDYGLWIDEEAVGGGFVVMDGHKELSPKYMQLAAAKRFVESQHRDRQSDSRWRI